MAREKRRQHWVPRGYLRRFACPEARKPSVWTASKSRRQVVRRRIDQVSVKSYLYSPRNRDGGRDHRMEDKLQALETSMGGRVWDAITADFVDFGDTAIRKGIALAAAVMYLRNPLRFDVTQQIRQSFLDMAEKYGVPAGFVDAEGTRREITEEEWREFRDESEDDQRRQCLRLLGNAAEVAEMLLDMRWCGLVSEEGAIVTTGNPVILTSPNLRPVSFQSADVTAFFPLSPTRAIAFDNRRGEPVNQYYQHRCFGNFSALLWR